ncbi:integrase arm-type DNA-binding domain-containing protein [uncultured Klebsiella sp.]|uniref:tyrosine-type recombinase/integrase n=1 Tax=uncultured Klebsiella sp. TaxID=284011 RepID=UPI0028050A6C|nr:integrase arm-type DNA-binding domain-containing protein [uncultured Klebsiella sp.]
MLSDTKLKNLKPKEKTYKVSDRDGLYVSVSPAGTIAFRYDYRINNRRETLTIGRYGHDGITLAEARERLMSARKMVADGISPSIKKRANKRLIRQAETFGDYEAQWRKQWRVAESTRAMRIAVMDKDVLPFFRNRLMHEITSADVRENSDKILSRGAPSTAVRAREMIYKVFEFARERGYEGENPAERVTAGSIAKFVPRERSLSEREVGDFFRALEKTGNSKTIQLSVKFVLLCLQRKSEFRLATWDMVDFADKILTIPAEIMKMSRPHQIYLSEQAFDILLTLHTVYPHSQYLHPGRFSTSSPLSEQALNAAINAGIKLARDKEGIDLSPFTVHDLRRTASTLLHEAGYPSDWIEKALAHEQKGARAVYNKAEYGLQRRYMLQQWANMIDAWISGERTKVIPFSPVKFEEWMREQKNA